MSKPANERLNATLQEINHVLPGSGQNLKDAIQLRLMREFHSGDKRAALSESISLGGFHVGGAARRKAERLYLLVQATVGGMTREQVRREKTRADAMSEAELKALIQAIADTHVATTFASNIEFAESFGYGSKDGSNKSFKAVIKAKRILGHMYQGLMTVRTNNIERRRYERWFGRFDPLRFEKVRASIKAVHDDITCRTLKLYYRGEGALGKLDDQPGMMYHNEHVKIRVEAGLYGAHIRGWPAGGAESDRTHILLGENFFKKCQIKSDPDSPFLMSGSGVIIHEMMHAVCDFRDEKNQAGEILYGPRKCQAAAIAIPHIAVINPDHYRLYSDTFDSDGE